MGIRIKGTETAKAILVLTKSMGKSWIPHFRLEVSKGSPFTLKFDIIQEKYILGVERQVNAAGFQLIEQINCCGILVSTKTYVGEDFLGTGYAQEMMKLKIALAKEFGYSAMLATVLMKNKAEVHILEKFGWKCVETFVNSRTQNTLGIFTLDLSNLAFSLMPL